MQFVDGDLLSVQEARILVENARDAQSLLKGYQQKDLDRAAAALIAGGQEKKAELIREEILETGAGNEQDKNSLFTEFLQELSADLKTRPVVGILKKDEDSKIAAIGVPLGVIAVLLPSENAVLNTIYTAVIAIKSGNAVVFVPDKKAAAVTKKTVELLKKIGEEAGLPKGIFSTLENISKTGVTELLNHSATALVLNIGCPKYNDATPIANKPIFYGGTGSTPVFIERTADIAQAVKEIVASRAFDNGILPAAEQFIIAESVIASKVKEQMISVGAYFMSAADEKQLLAYLKLAEGNANGKNARYLAEKAGFSVPEQTKVLVSEQPYIYEENPFAEELKCPILTFYLEPDWLHACEKCIQLLQDKKNGHTLAIHSKNQEIIQEFALKKPVGRIVVNANASFTSLGLHSSLAPSMILGGLTTGRGICAESITAKELTYVRQVAYSNKTWTTQTDKQLNEAEKRLLEKLFKKLAEQ